MDSARERLLREVMAADFTLIELNLYLNTHPYDQRAITIFNECLQKAKALRQNYERLYGPITPMTPSKCPWQWIEDPWPWQ
ncbi:spore coat protein CotJB [Clostridium thermosuccinogenes]|jgi:spore coat protein JB|uniref:Spore coat protein CotJB n=1 Tax=Clostridium thermosuccinogenes TaxID=84032 RepID=A0A2K2FH26_9CLOT|nr:spore coat protein CotJB [Pseudoclostridium thermosuccinogenes]AUS96204.1 spore coat protein CotJB [Pseudoclostridium thermosuccinogenes]PNT93115.1 spore coat protein CotJB [Pseudoclostridium thermosuccinogenes]PNT96421.1 spore coat protein CotJB [Pseudoclostridium thermosuccinogenes]PNT98074.1 spore coat protein CotJB [Pseudoclostridium thermosuccinogenes]